MSQTEGVRQEAERGAAFVDFLLAAYNMSAPAAAEHQMFKSIPRVSGAKNVATNVMPARTTTYNAIGQ